MTEKELELAQENAEMKGDLKAAIGVFYDVVKSLGINLEDFNKTDESMTEEDHALQLKKKMPMIMQKITMAVLGGGLNAATLSKFSELKPLMEKYKDLLPETESKTQQED